MLQFVLEWMESSLLARIEANNQELGQDVKQILRDAEPLDKRIFSATKEAFTYFHREKEKNLVVETVRDWIQKQVHPQTEDPQLRADLDSFLDPSKEISQDSLCQMLQRILGSQQAVLKTEFQNTLIQFFTTKVLPEIESTEQQVHLCIPRRNFLRSNFDYPSTRFGESNSGSDCRQSPQRNDSRSDDDIFYSFENARIYRCRTSI